MSKNKDIRKFGLTVSLLRPYVEKNELFNIYKELYLVSLRTLPKNEFPTPIAHRTHFMFMHMHTYYLILLLHVLYMFYLFISRDGRDGRNVDRNHCIFLRSYLVSHCVNSMDNRDGTSGPQIAPWHEREAS